MDYALRGDERREVLHAIWEAVMGNAVFDPYVADTLFGDALDFKVVPVIQRLDRQVDNQFAGRIRNRARDLRMIADLLEEEIG